MAVDTTALTESGDGAVHENAHDPVGGEENTAPEQTDAESLGVHRQHYVKQRIAQ